MVLARLLDNAVAALDNTVALAGAHPLAKAAASTEHRISGRSS